jgi:hypothetical protein
VRDEHVGQAELALQAEQQVDDLGLDRDVERAQRLVADDEARLGRQRPGDADALALAAAELARQALGGLGAEADEIEQLGDAPLPRRGGDAADEQRLADDRRDALARIEAGVRGPGRRSGGGAGRRAAPGRPAASDRPRRRRRRRRSGAAA